MVMFVAFPYNVLQSLSEVVSSSPSVQLCSPSRIHYAWVFASLRGRSAKLTPLGLVLLGLYICMKYFIEVFHPALNSFLFHFNLSQDNPPTLIISLEFPEEFH